MPISGTRWLGMSTGQLVLAGASAVLVLAGVVLIGVSSGPSDTPGLVTGVVLGLSAWWSGDHRSVGACPSP